MTRPLALALITHQGPRTLRPDALSKVGKTPDIEGVTDQKTYSDGTMSVTLFTESGQHVRDMLIAYFPKERLLVEADLYAAGAPLQMFANAFLGELKQRNLRIDRIAPLHGPVASYAQFVKDAAAPPPTAN